MTEQNYNISLDAVDFMDDTAASLVTVRDLLTLFSAELNELPGDDEAATQTQQEFLTNCLAFCIRMSTARAAIDSALSQLSATTQKVSDAREKVNAAYHAQRDAAQGDPKKPTTGRASA